MFVIFIVIRRTFDPRLAAAAAASHPAWPAPTTITSYLGNSYMFHVKQSFKREVAKIRNAQ
jgi:hypothetical protein